MASLSDIQYRLLEEKALLQAEYRKALEQGDSYRVHRIRGQFEIIERVLTWLKR